MGFIDGIKARAKVDKKTIVLPESYDMRVIEAASKIVKEGVADVILIGDPDDIAKSAAGFDLTGVQIVNPETFERLDDFIVHFYELRKRKGMTLNDSRRILTSNFLFFGVMMIKMGLADGMVGGCTTPTANLLRPSLQILKTAPESKLVSAFFVLDVPNCEYGADGVFIFSDAGLNQNPTSEELAHIAYDSAKTFETLVGKKPITAMLSHSTMGSASHADVDKVRNGVEFAHKEYPDLLVDGEFQLDAAIVPEVGQQKAPGNEIAGHANVLIFPDLDAGNIGYKLVQRLAKAEAYGPITQGLAGPVNDLSRGCSADDIVGVTAITAVQAQMSKKN